MPQNTHLDVIRPEADGLPQPASEASLAQTLREKARSLAHSLSWLPNTPSSNTFSERCALLKALIQTTNGDHVLRHPRHGDSVIG